MRCLARLHQVQFHILWFDDIVPEVFKLHMEELRGMQEQISKRDNEIKLLEAIIQTLGGKERLRKSGVNE